MILHRKTTHLVHFFSFGPKMYSTAVFIVDVPFCNIDQWGDIVLIYWELKYLQVFTCNNSSCLYEVIASSNCQEQTYIVPVSNSSLLLRGYTDNWHSKV
jgi:hypothetical protein